METNTTAHNEDLVFTEIPFPKRKVAYEKPAVVINSVDVKLKMYKFDEIKMLNFV